LPQGLSALRHRNFRLFWVGQLISLIGTWMQTVAQGWLLVELTNGDAVALGLLAATQFLPVLALGLFGGVLADAVPKRNALVATQVISGVLALVLGLLVLDKSVQVWHIFVLAGLLGTVSAFDMPIRQSFVVEMVGREDIANAVALNSAVFNGTRIIGPAVAGILIATLGLAACFLINAASYVAVIAGLLVMREEELHRAPVSGLERTLRSVAGQLAEGLRYVRDTPTTFMAIAIVGVVSTAALNFVVLLPLLAQDVLGGGATTYGFLSSAAGVGSLIGALSLAFGSAPSFRRLLVGAAAVGVAMIGLGISTWLPLSLVLMTIAGWGLIAMAATTNTIIQLNTPDHLRGRVVSVYTTVFAGSTPFGGVISGSIAATAGTPAAFLVAGVVSLLAVGAALVLRREDVTSSDRFDARTSGDVVVGAPDGRPLR
jgi:MFS family permease